MASKAKTKSTPRARAAHPKPDPIYAEIEQKESDFDPHSRMPIDVLSARIQQAAAMVEALQNAMHAEPAPDHGVIGDALWGVAALLEQADEAYDAMPQRGKR